MKKLLLPLAIGSALSLVGCGSGDEAPVTETEVSVAASRVVFDPSNGALSVPTNILLSGSTDGTLNLPVDDASDIADPQVAINGLDGWGTHSTLTFDFSLPVDENGEQVTIEAASLEAQGSIRVFETIQGGNDVSEQCAAANPAAVCAITGELEHNTDFTVKATGEGSVAVVPLRPFKPKTGYLVVLTDNIQDSLGRDVKPSQTYTLMKRNADEKPVSGDESAVSLQRLVNSYEGSLEQFGVDPEGVIYSSNFTTQSVGDVLNVVKQQIAGQYTPSLTLNNSGNTVADTMAANNLTAPPSAALADFYVGNVTLPYYSAHPDSATNADPTTGRWRAACDSPAAILNALQAEDEDNQLKDADIASLPSDFTEDPTLLLPPNNCSDFDTKGGDPVDPDRYLTQYNPVPVPSTQVPVPVYASIPNGANGATMPANGWPVVILQHGITADKSSIFGIAGTLASQGIATVAIDHPLHGDRGFDLDEDGTVEYIAEDGSATAYMNLQSLLTTRDNLRQSISDLLGLRYSLNNVTGAQFDPTKVHFIGHSLGAITGTSFSQIANIETDNAQLNAAFSVKASVLGMPGGSIANFLLASDSFGPTIKSTLLYSANPEFKAAADEAIAGGASLEEFYAGFMAQASDEQVAQINATFEQFAFAAQTVVDSGDPVNYAADLVENTPVFVIESDGDAVIPNAVENKPLAGTQPLVGLMQLSDARPPESTVPVQSEDGSPISAYASFLGGSHASLLDPTASAEVTTEMQTQIVSWFGSGLLAIPVDNEEVVE